jgi:hypothetical protein
MSSWPTCQWLWWHPPVSEIPMAYFQTVKIIMAYFHLTQMFRLRGKTKKLPPLSPRKSFKEASRTENNLCFVLTGLPDELVCAQWQCCKPWLRTKQVLPQMSKVCRHWVNLMHPAVYHSWQRYAAQGIKMQTIHLSTRRILPLSHLCVVHWDYAKQWLV